MEQKQKKVLFFGIMKRKWNEEQEAYEAKEKRNIGTNDTRSCLFIQGNHKSQSSLNDDKGENHDI